MKNHTWNKRLPLQLTPRKNTPPSLLSDKNLYFNASEMWTWWDNGLEFKTHLNLSL